MPVKSSKKHDHNSGEKFLSSRTSIPAWREPAFEQRRVQALKAPRDMTERDINIHLKHNRVLQKGFGAYEGEKLIKMLRRIDTNASGKAEWTTQYVQPSIENAIYMHIAAKVICDYRVSTDELNEKTLTIFNQFSNEVIKKIEDACYKRIEHVNQAVIFEAAESMYKAKHPGENEFDKHKEDYIELQRLEINKKIINEVVSGMINEEVQTIAKDLGFEPKPLYKPGENHDISLLGAAGSGKSSAINTLQTPVGSPVDKRDYAVLATDDYRGIYMPETEDHEALKTSQVFTRTQDSAYLIKEIVNQYLVSKTERKEARPDVLLDCVSLEEDHVALLKHNASTQSFVVVMSDVRAIPGRAYDRAINENASIADKGRHANTTALLEGHAQASQLLLSNIPPELTTRVLDTNVKAGKPPICIASIHNSENKKLVVHDLKRFSDFMGKSNLNAEARRVAYLYKHTKKKKYQFTYDDLYKADSILACLKVSKVNPAFSMTLEHQGKAYVKLKFTEEGKYTFDIIDERVFKDKANGSVLRSIIISAYCKNNNLDIREQVFELGEASIFNQAIKSEAMFKFKPSVHRIKEELKELKSEESEKTKENQERPKV